MAGLPYFPTTLPAQTVVGNLAATPREAQAIPIASLSSQLADASTITFTSAGAGAVARSVQSKERETVSVTDKGAKGDGVTNDTAAFQAAHDDTAEGTAIRIPCPTSFYLLNSTVTLTKGHRWVGDSDEATQQATGSRIKTTNAIDPFTVNPASSAKVFQFENLTIIGGTNGMNFTAAGLYISRQSYLKNVSFDAQTNAAIKTIMGMIGCHNQNLNMEGTGSYGIWAEGTNLLNASQWDTVRVANKTVEAIHTKASSGAVQWNNLIIESNPGRGIYSAGDTHNIFNPWFETNGSTAGAPDVYLDASGGASGQVHLFGGLMNTGHANQANVRVFANADACSYSEWNTVHQSVSDIINANDTTLRVRLLGLTNFPAISAATRLDKVITTLFNESGNVQSSGLAMGVNPNTGVTVTRGNITRVINKAVFATSAFTAAALTQDFTIFTPVAKTVVTGAWIKVTQAFTGTAWATAVVRLSAHAAQDYIVDTSVMGSTPWIGDADAEVGSALNRANAVQGGDFNNGTGNIALRITTTGGNVSAITAGALEVYIESHILP